jgi:hypothetical protein
MDKVLFINDVLSVREQTVEAKPPPGRAPILASGQPRQVVLHIEVETETGRQVLSLSMDLARQLLTGLDHVLNGTGD